ncbi:MAG: NADPH-dependent glutamate synthase [Bacteroidales bacterium]|nr:NADPH-dependent glutamate synthase [Bacteroidales bacterium]MBN2820252.1 NADPH-dependent glutamate synthase [Bacteroidales bacterium]
MSNNIKQDREEEWRIDLRKSIKAKDRTALERIRMPEVEPNIRVKSHIEVNMGLSPEQAIAEAGRCLDCVNPTCMEGCPVGVNIPKFIKYIEAGLLAEAANTLNQTNMLPAVCGRVCPQEIQCEANCFYTLKLHKPAVGIGNLERYVADWCLNNQENIAENKIVTGPKVAVIGGGPAGLTAAGDLARLNYQVTIFEALHDFGGVLKYGIPEFRLPNNIVNFEIEKLKKEGVKFVKNFVVGKTATLEDLREEGFQAFFIGSGAGLPRFMNIPGENYNGILSSNEYLTRVNLMNASNPEFDTPVDMGKNVAVIGGGNTAMDSVRTAKRLGAERAIIIYRRSIDEMPARKEEIHHAIEEGIEFITLTNPIEYFADSHGNVNKVRVQKMELGEPDSSGRRKPVPINGSEYDIAIDQVIVSVGVSPNPIVPKSIQNLAISKWQTIEVNPETMQSNIEGVFAGGDIVRGGATVILAMGDGRKAAAGIHQYLQDRAN